MLILVIINLAVNRRLDEWVKLDQLDLESVETVVDEKVEDKVWRIDCYPYGKFSLRILPVDNICFGYA